MALPGINDRIVDQTMSLSTSSLAFEKYTGGTAQDIVLFLHGIEENFRHKLATLWKEDVLLRAFTRDTRKCEVVRFASLAAEKVVEQSKAAKARERFDTRSPQKDIMQTAKKITKKKIEMLDSVLADNNAELPIVDKDGVLVLDITPRKNITKTKPDRSVKETIRRNLSEELTLEYYSEETMTEANEYIKMTEQLKSKFTPKETEGVAGKRDKELLKIFHVCTHNLVLESVLGQVPDAANDYEKEIKGLHEEKKDARDPALLVDTDKSLENTRRKLYQNLSSPQLLKVTDLLKYVRHQRQHLNVYMWFCSLFRLKTELENLKEDIHDVLANTLDEVFSKAGDNSSAMPKLDARVQRGTMTRFEFYVEMLESRDRAAKTTAQVSDPEKSFSGIKKIEEIAEKNDIDNKEIDASVFAMGLLSKDPAAKLIYEKLTKLESRMCESSFTKDEDKEKKKKEEEEKKEKPEDKKEKSSKRKKSKDKDSSSGSDSDDKSSRKKTKDIISLMNKKFEDQNKRFDELKSNGFQNQNQNQNGFSQNQNHNNTSNRSQNAQNQTSVPNECWYFSKHGTCSYGDNCKKLHIVRTQGSTQNTQNSNSHIRANVQNGNAQGKSQNENSNSNGQVQQKRFPEFRREKFCESLWTTGKCENKTCSGPHGDWDDTNEKQCYFEQRNEKCPFIGNKKCRLNHKHCVRLKKD